jgi:hypothetical protein
MSDSKSSRSGLPTITPVAMFTAWNQAFSVKGEDGKTAGTIEDVVQILNDGLDSEYSEKYTVSQVRARKQILNKALIQAKGFGLPKLKSMNQGLAGKAKAEAARQALAEGMELSFIESWNSDDSATGQSE